MTADLIIGGNSLLGWFRSGGIELGDQMWKRVIVIFIYSFIPLGLLAPRDLQVLAPFTTVTFGCICLFVISLIVKVSMLYTNGKERPEITIADVDIGVFSAISIYAFAFALPVVVLPIVRSYNGRPRKRAMVSFMSIFLCFLTVGLAGIFGYLLFGNETEGVVLDSFEQDDIFMQVVKGGFFLVVTFAYPCIGQSVMGLFSQLFFKEADPTKLITTRRIVLLGSSAAIPLLLALFLPKAGPALSVGGAFGGCIADFFFPAFMWFKLSQKKWYSFSNIICLIMAGFGVLAAALATYIAIIDAISAFG
jgi:amino acid permease